MGRLHNSCTMLRRVKLTHHRLNITTGKSRMVGTEVMTRPCDAPLFKDEDRKAGLCGSCASGWTDPDNRPATAEEAATYEAEAAARLAALGVAS